MKKALMLFAGVALAGTVHAQISFAPELGLNLANMQLKVPDLSGGGKESVSSTLKLGVKAGVNVNIPITPDRLVLQPGIFYSIKGYKTDNDFGKNNVTLHYAEIPLYLQYMFNDPSEGRLFVGVGPYLGIAFSGQNKTENMSGADTTESLTFGSGADQSYGRFDYGAGVNVGYMLRSGLFFRGQYQMSIGNLVPSESPLKDDASARNSVFTVSVGYQLGHAPKSKGPAMKGSDAR